MSIDVVGLTQELVKIPSVSGNENPVAEFEEVFGKQEYN